MGILTGGWNPFRTPIRKLIGGITDNKYFAGKEGYLPDIKLPEFKIKGVKSSYYPTGEASLSEIFSAEGYKKGGQKIRKTLTSRAEGFSTGLFGVGVVEYAKGEEGWLPDWGRPGQFPKVLDATGKGKGLINIEIPEFPKLPEIPKIPDIDLSGIGAGIGAGLSGLGQNLGSGIPQMPSMPSMKLIDEEGQPNILLLGGLSLVAYIVLKGAKK